jgi:DNA gyrase/topoisomerase IV subunit A
MLQISHTHAYNRMAQNFVGSNNINLLYPSGQFGTRLLGGNDSASPRYIFTKLAKITRAIFPEADDPVLEYLYEEGQKIEPEFYCPVIPMALVNGCSGIATGWSTEVPMVHNYSQISQTYIYFHFFLTHITHTHAHINSSIRKTLSRT